MKRENILIKNTIIYAIGTFSSRFLNFLMVPLYTNFLTVSQYGYLDLILTTVSLFVPIITFQISDGVYRFLLGTEVEREKKKIFTNSMFILIRNLMILCLTFSICRYFFNINHSFIIIFYFISFIIFDFLNQVARALKKNLVFALSSFINSIITIVLTLLFLKMKMGIIAPLMSGSFSMIITGIFIWVKLGLHSYYSWKYVNKKIRKDLIIYSVPLIPNIMNWWIMNISDRYLISFFLGIGANGIYAIASKISSILLIINNVFNLAWQESAITEYKSKDKNIYYSKIFNNYLFIQIFSYIALLAMSNSLFDLFIDQKYHGAIKFLPCLYLGAIFSACSSFYGTGFQSSKETKGAFYSSIFGSLINVLINIIALPLIGIQAASISTMLAFFTMWILRMYQTRKYFKIVINIKLSVLLVFIIISSTILFYYNQIYLLCYVALIYILMGLKFYKEAKVKIIHFKTKLFR